MQEKLLELISGVYQPLLLHVGEQGELLQHVGDYRFFGIDLGEQKNTYVYEIIPILYGLDWPSCPTLPLVNLDNGVIADLQISPAEIEGYYVLVTNATVRHDEQQGVQQTRNEVVLLNNKLETMRLELEKKTLSLESANNAKGQFIAGMSHEFRTPIMGMLGNITRIRNSLSSEPVWFPSLNTIESNANYLLTLVENLLQQQKLDTRSVSIKKVIVPIRNLVENVCESLQPLADTKGLVMTRAIELSETLNIWVDDSNLRRTLYNLLGNAIKFTDRGEVKISAVYSDSLLSITILDTGIGIPQADLENIFLPFSRGENVAHKTGSGLGLAHVKGIVDSMDGQISISSKVARGTVIELTIPVEISEAIPQVEELEENHNIVSGSVLIVEDNEDLKQLCQYFFDAANIHLVTVSDGAGMKRVLEDFEPKLVFVDYMLANETGIDLVKELRETGYQQRIIMLTASLDIDESLRKRAYSAGCDDFMGKPSNIADLVTLAKQHLISLN